VNQRNR